MEWRKESKRLSWWPQYNEIPFSSRESYDSIPFSTYWNGTQRLCMCVCLCESVPTSDRLTKAVCVGDREGEIKADFLLNHRYLLPPLQPSAEGSRILLLFFWLSDQKKPKNNPDPFSVAFHQSCEDTESARHD